jgi:uncharacterized protein (DUF2336 family)
VNVSVALIDEFDSALKIGSAARRIEVLQRITNLFVRGATNFTEQQTTLFDVIMGRLVSHIETRAIVELSERLAPIPTAPVGIIQRLAWDDAIEISGPVLANSDRLTDHELVRIAETKSQAHLARIATRARVSEPVTDVLVDRGDPEVATKVAANAGARFSETGILQLVMRAEDDDRLAETIGGRPDVPPHMFRQILMRATDEVRQRLLASARPDAKQAIIRILAEISAQVKESVISRDYAVAKLFVRALGHDIERIKTALPALANEKRAAELIVGLSVIAAVPIELVERLFYDDNVLGMLVLCKAVTLDWTIVQAIILAQPGASGPGQLDEASASYLKLSRTSAQRLLRFWQAYQKVA